MTESPAKSRFGESGFGLVELIVAMAIIAIVLMALAPFLVSSFQASARNVRIAGATELVNQRIDLAQSRAYTASCASFKAFVDKYVGTTGPENLVEDPRRNITFEVRTGAYVAAPGSVPFSEAACAAAVAAGEPESYFLTVEVQDSRDAKVLARAKTWVSVPGFAS